MHTSPGWDRRLKMFFERVDAGRLAYPACEDVLTRIALRYGEPSRVQEFDEGAGRNRRFIWWSGYVTITLRGNE